ncbi:Ig heavy chain V region 6.96 [Sciurus carolinensis]|uniref:Ig heavy chain V region 6.96 n=1 Tax=Sciurus carolinensis TaxID=30640 RepID=A0AA41N3N4_SCICA|nr:Ig heavy chain V region 6.96 [Sciurus carolinensis]
MLLLLLLLGPSSGLGAHVSQHPSRAICKSGTSVKIECHSVGIQFQIVFWYRQFPKKSFVLMATSNPGSDVTWEQDIAQDKFSVSHPNLTFASLMVTSAHSEDSGFYFCGASDTVLCVSQRPRQEGLQQPAPPTLRPRSPVGGAWGEKTTASLNETSVNIVVGGRVM